MNINFHARGVAGAAALVVAIALPGTALGHGHEGHHANYGNHCGKGHQKHTKAVGQTCAKHHHGRAHSRHHHEGTSGRG